jgi:mono/diheme cytochrome c family protein
MPRWLLPASFVLAALALIPFACVARSRAIRTPATQVHVFPDMDQQPKFKAQQPNPLFADGRAMRGPVAGTVPRGTLLDDDHLLRGVVGEDWAAENPLGINATLLAEGREKFEVFCTPCHGHSGYGDGIVGKRAEALQEGAWVPPSSLHTELVRTRPDGHLYNSITNGIRSMPGYGDQTSVEERWAIVAYVRALQRSQNATIQDVPDEVRPELR